MLQALVEIYKSEGSHGFYRGLTPALLQTVPMAGTSFSVFAVLKDLITVMRKYIGQNIKRLVFISQ